MYIKGQLARGSLRALILKTGKIKIVFDENFQFVKVLENLVVT
jgi:hypothetical protein